MAVVLRLGAGCGGRLPGTAATRWRWRWRWPCRCSWSSPEASWRCHSTRPGRGRRVRADRDRRAVTATGAGAGQRGPGTRQPPAADSAPSALVEDRATAVGCHRRTCSPPSEVVEGLTARDPDGRRRDLAAVALPAALAAVLCFLQIAGRSLGFDEAATVTIASQHGSALWTAIAHDGGNMSGYYLVLHLLIGVFGQRAGGDPVRVGAGVDRHRGADRASSACGCSIAGSRSSPGCSPRSACRWCTGRRTHAATRRWWRSCAPRSWPSSPSRGRRRACRRRPATALDRLRGVHGAGGVFELRGRAGGAGAVAAGDPAPGAGAAAGGRRWRWWRSAARRWSVLATSRGSSQLFWVPRPTRKVETQVLQALTSAGLQPNFHRIADHDAAADRDPGGAAGDRRW